MKRESHHSAGVIVYRGEDRREYLLVRSAQTRKPVWEFPKGGIETGESELDAALRELAEETGLTANDYVLLDGFQREERYYFTIGGGKEMRLVRKRVDYFLAEWRQGEVQLSEEATRYAWATASEARKMLKFPQKRQLLAHAEAWLRQRTPNGL